MSTDSNDSQRRVETGSETDESFGDGHSESGAESVETHSVFFGSYRKPSYIVSSLDSGVGSDFKLVEPFATHAEEGGSSDSETMSFTTVVPVGSTTSSLSSKKGSILVKS